MKALSEQHRWVLPQASSDLSVAVPSLSRRLRLAPDRHLGKGFHLSHIEGLQNVNDDHFAGCLLTGERIVWSGRPRRGLMLTAGDLFLIPFSLFWAGFAIFWETMVLSMKAPGFMALFGVPFVLIGLFLVFGRLPFDAWLRSKLHYALTDRRILILRAGPWGSFKAIGLDRLPEATLTEGSDGRGTIRFGQPTAFWNSYGRGAGIWIPSLDPASQFLGIDNARRVFAMVQERSQGRTPRP